MQSNLLFYKRLFFLFIIFSILCTTTAGAQTDCTQEGVTGIPQFECEALVALYSSTSGSNWTKAGLNN